MQTFIERHGYVQYSDIQRANSSGTTACLRIRSCEICGSADHLAYEFDHCHEHGWVRGVLCGPCNTAMRQVDRGMVRVDRYIAHWSRCPDCRELGAPRPAEPKPPPCAGCNGCGHIWLGYLARMVRCPACQGGDVP